MVSDRDKQITKQKAGHPCKLIDIDLEGNDISNSRDIPSWHDCALLCNKTAECDSFTWTPDNFNTCYLKHGVPSQSASTGAISGRSDCVQGCPANWHKLGN